VLRLFVPSAQISSGCVRIGGAELKHLRTLRLAPGATLVVFDERGEEHEVRLERLGSRVAEARILATHRPARESSLELTLAAALVKGARIDFVIEKATELGVARIVPLLTRYAVARGAPLERWRRIALAAAKQSGRTRVPTVDAPVALSALVRAPRAGLGVLVWEGEQARRLSEIPPAANAVTLVTGPEGGFTTEEVDEARVCGFLTVSLGPRILRAETAALVAVALCQHRWGDVG
jgi:16S rRNA (uracil1498-N3)-methyltransferase